MHLHVQSVDFWMLVGVHSSRGRMYVPYIWLIVLIFSITLVPTHTSGDWGYIRVGTL